MLFKKAPLLIAASFIALSGCAPEEDDSAVSALDLPPEETLLMDFSVLPSANAKATIDALSYYDYSSSTYSKAAQDYYDSMPSYATQLGGSNYDFASGRVGGWGLLALAATAIPKAAFQAAFAHQPQQQSDGSWQWSYRFGLQNQARLVGSVSNNQVHWDMYITKDDQSFVDANWFSGTHNLDMTAGTWTLRHGLDQASLVDTLAIEWERNPTTNTKRLRYTIANPNDVLFQQNSYIEYGISTDPTYDAYFTIHNLARPADIQIQWNRNNSSGRVQSSNSSDFAIQNYWYNWDSNHTDI